MSWNVSGVAQTPPSLDQSRCNLAVSTSAQSQRLSRSAAQSSSSDGTGNRLYWSIVTSCAYRAAASLPLSVEGFIWRGLGNQGLGSPRLLVWSSDASLVVQGGEIHAWCGLWGAHRRPSTARSAQSLCAHVRTNAGRGGRRCWEGRGSPRLLVCPATPVLVVQGAETHAWCGLWGARRRPSTARSAQSLCAQWVRTNAERWVARRPGRVFLNRRRAAKEQSLVGFWDAWKAARKCDFFLPNAFGEW